MDQYVNYTVSTSDSANFTNKGNSASPESLQPNCIYVDYELLELEYETIIPKPDFVVIKTKL